MIQRISQEQIKELCNVPWIYKEADCWALFRKCSRIIGVDIHDLNLPEKSSPRKNSEVFEAEMMSPKWEKVEQATEGSAIVFYGNSDKAFHIGFALNSKWMLHSMGTPKLGGRSSCDKINSLIQKGLFKRYEIYNYTG